MLWEVLFFIFYFFFVLKMYTAAMYMFLFLDSLEGYFGYLDSYEGYFDSLFFFVLVIFVRGT